MASQGMGPDGASEFCPADGFGVANESWGCAFTFGRPGCALMLGRPGCALVIEFPGCALVFGWIGSMLVLGFGLNDPFPAANGNALLGFD